MPTSTGGHFFWRVGLLNHLKSLFGNKPTTPAPQPEKRITLDQAATSAAASQKSAAYLCREAVFDRKNKLAGHLFRLHGSSAQAIQRDAIQCALDRQLIDTLNASPEAWNTNLAIIPINSGSLSLATVNQLKPVNLVLIIQLATDAKAELLIPRITALRDRGISIGVFRQPKNPAFTEVIALADFGAIDIAGSEANSIRDFAAAFRSKEKITAHLFGCEIDTEDEYRLCHQWHFSYFHGKFAATHPQRQGDTGADPHKMQLLHLMRLVQGEAETAEIVDAMKQDPVLTFRILRYLNSPALGLSHKIDSLSQALVILGRQRLSRWLAVLAFSVKEPNIGDWLLVENALTRGRIMEVLGQELMPQLPHDQLFLTGIFSCLDRLLRRPLVELLNDMPLPDNIRNALIDQTGPYAPLLAVAKAGEAYDIPQMEISAQAANIDPDTLNRALLAATAWASEVTEHWE
jgi:EAL and modified HD-GYP domain-containing signal transduction protein